MSRDGRIVDWQYKETFSRKIGIYKSNLGRILVNYPSCRH